MQRCLLVEKRLGIISPTGFSGKVHGPARPNDCRAIAPFQPASSRRSRAGQGSAGSSPDVIWLAVSMASWAMEVLLELDLMVFFMVFLGPLAL
jgi:hypothetical protein